MQESGEDQGRRHSVIPILLAFGEIAHFEGAGRRLPNKGRYECAASAKPRLETISPQNLMPGQKSAQKPNDWASFHDSWSAKLENFQQVGHFFHSYQILHIFGQKLPKNLMPEQNLPHRT